MQVEKPCLSNAPNVLASQCLKFRACFSFIMCPISYVLAGQRQVPEVQINVIYVCALQTFNRARLKENELQRKELLSLTCPTPPAGTVPGGAPWVPEQEGGKGRPKAPRTEIKQNSNTLVLKLPLLLLLYESQAA